MALKDVLVVKFANRQDIKQWDDLHSKTLRSSSYPEKMRVFPARKECNSMDRTEEICDVARRTIDSLGAENSSYEHFLRVRIRSW